MVAVADVVAYSIAAARMRRSGQHKYLQKPFKKVYVRVSDDAPTFPIHPQNETVLWKQIRARQKAEKSGKDVADGKRKKKSKRSEPASLTLSTSTPGGLVTA